MEISLRSIDSSLTNVLQLANSYLKCIKVKSRGWAWKKADAAYNQLKSAAPY